jgi:hypothetical protein
MKNLKWKPANKKAAVCFSIDDIHPGTSNDYFEAGGDMEKGSLGEVQWLLERHQELSATLFTTADWREIHPFPTKKILSRLPILRDKFYLAPILPKGTMDLRNHPVFVNYLNNLSQFEVAYHGLYHVHKGLKIPVEFQNQSKNEFNGILTEMLKIYSESRLNHVMGICPPGWNAPPELMEILVEHGFDFINSSRDLLTPISKNATCNMSGLKDTPLIFPCMLAQDKLIHFPVNFQANSRIDRAIAILENGGLLSIKAHIINQVGSYVAIDGVNKLYMNYLDILIYEIKRRYGDKVWFTSMGEISNYIKKNN